MFLHREQIRPEDVSGFVSQRDYIFDQLRRSNSRDSEKYVIQGHSEDPG